MTEKATIRVLAPRMTQLRQIAEARGLPGVNALLDHWIHKEIEAGTIPPGVPGVAVEINTADRRGEMTLGELKLNPTSDEAKELSNAIRQIAAGHQKALATRVAKLRAAGVAFAIESLDGKATFTGGATLLRDVADQIDREIATTK